MSHILSIPYSLSSFLFSCPENIPHTFRKKTRTGRNAGMPECRNMEAGLLGVPDSPEKEKKGPFLARIGKLQNHL